MRGCERLQIGCEGNQKILALVATIGSRNASRSVKAVDKKCSGNRGVLVGEYDGKEEDDDKSVEGGESS